MPNHLFKKIVCTNIESCGYVEKNIKQKEESQKFATVCTRCGSLALYYYQDYDPLYLKDFSSLDIENLLIQAYLQLNKLQ